MASPRALELARRIWAWAPHSDGQRDWMLSGAKVKVAACGRRWGKSESTALEIVLDALEMPNTITIVVAPTADQTSIIMDEVERRLYSIPGFKLGRDFDHRRSPYNEITFRDGNNDPRNLRIPTTIMARTAGTTGRGLRGRKAHKVVCDESAFISDRIMLQVVTPLLADYDGQRVEVSTPDGLNHFYEDFDRGQKGSPNYNERYESFRFPTSDNPHIAAEYLENERRTKPERDFNQEYLAQFLNMEGAVFRKVAEACRAVAQAKAVRGHQYLFGVDWGRSRDWTVIAVCDVTTREVVHVERFNEIGWDLQRRRLMGLYTRFAPVAILAEANSIGEPNIEALQDQGLPVRPFWTTNATKAVIVGDLVLALEQGSLALPAGDSEIARIARAELLSFEAKRTPSGLWSYSAPEGKHDDVVIALCLAAHGLSNSHEYARSGVQAVAASASQLAGYAPR